MTLQLYLWVYICKKRNTSSKIYMNPNVQSSIIYNCQDMEAS